jgi:hypothetical protein
VIFLISVASNEVVELSLDELGNLRLADPLWDFSLGFWVVIHSRILICVHILHILVLHLVVEAHLPSHALCFWKLAFVWDKCLSHSEVSFLLQSVSLIHRSFSLNTIIVLHSFLIGVIDTDIVVPVKLLVGLVITKKNSISKILREEKPFTKES